MKKITDKEENSEDNVPFNMSMLFYLRVSKIMEFKDESAIRGNIIDWHRALSAIFRNIEFVIDEKNAEEIRSELKKTSASLTLNNSSILVSLQIEKNLSKIDSLIMTAMNRKGMIFPNINTTMGLNTIKQRYNLQ